MRKTILSVAAFVLFILVMTGCEMVKTIEESTPISLNLSKTEVTVKVGDVYTLPATATVTYVDGTTKTVTVEWDKTVSTATVGIYTYTASYTENKVTKNAILTLKVEEKVVISDAKLTGLKLDYDTATVIIWEAYTLPTTGTATYSDGTTKTVTLTWDKTVDTAKAGTFTYVASYTEGNIAEVATFTLVVKTISTPTLSSLKVSPTTYTVAVGDKYTLPTTGTATYSDGTTKTVTLTWNKAATTTAVGTTTYTASYTENSVTKSATFTLVVKTITTSTLSSLTISPTTATVTVGDKYTLPTTGIAKYTDGTTKTVMVEWDKTVSTTTAGTYTYVASYTEGDIAEVATFTLVVKAAQATLSSLTISPTTATVNAGTAYTLPTTGTATYSNGTTKTVTLTWNKAVSTTTAGTTTYTASYTENSVTKSATFTLVVKAVQATLSSISLSSSTATVSVGAVYTLPTTGTATYSDGTTKTVTLTWNKAVSTTTAGTTTYTASYTENSVTKSTSFTLVVAAISPKFTIEDITASVNGTVEVTVKASGFTTEVAAIDLRLYADSTYLKYNSTEFTGVALGGLTIAKTDEKNASNVVLANIPSSPIILDGAIIKIKFTAIKTGSTKINMISTELLDSNGLKLAGTDISDTATVTIK